MEKTSWIQGNARDGMSTKFWKCVQEVGDILRQRGQITDRSKIELLSRAIVEELAINHNLAPRK